MTLRATYISATGALAGLGLLCLVPFGAAAQNSSMQELLNFAVVNNKSNHIKVLIDMGQKIRLDVEDNGTGFNPDKIETDEATIGIKVIRDRVEMLGGEITIESAVGQGSRCSWNGPDISGSRLGKDS